VDPGGWVDDKKVEADSLYEKYLELLKSGELLPGTTFQMFEKHYLDFDTDIISKIKKRVKDKKITEGLAAILGVSPDRI
jgi:oligoribonuclease NrnB/cAMP/cGMP phosphodiesterase (DHH superfamily)